MSVLVLAVALVLGTVLSGCAVPVSSGSGPVDPIAYGEPVDLGVPGPLIETVPGVAGYPACGTEPITHAGVTWYPFEPSNLDEFPVAAALVGAATGGGLGGGTMRAALPAIAAPAVVAPGPGDDVGTLSIYDGGFAFWVSDSGDLETWLTDRPLEYLWIC